MTHAKTATPTAAAPKQVRKPVPAVVKPQSKPASQPDPTPAKQVGVQKPAGKRIKTWSASP